MALLGSVYAVVFFLGVFSDGIQQALLRTPPSGSTPASSLTERGGGGGVGGEEHVVTEVKVPQAPQTPQTPCQVNHFAGVATATAQVERAEASKSIHCDIEDDYAGANITYSQVDEPDT